MLATLTRAFPTNRSSLAERRQQSRAQKATPLPVQQPSIAPPRWRRAAAAAASAAGGGAQAGPGVQLTLPDGTSVGMPQSTLVVGSGPGADVQLSGSGVAAQARLEAKSGRLFVTPLTGDPNALLSPTACWLDGVELRPGVAYLVAPGARLAVGSQDSCVTCSFEERGGSSAMSEMLMRGLAASEEVRAKLDSDL